MINRIKDIFHQALFEASYRGLKIVGNSYIKNVDSFFFNKIDQLDVYKREEYLLKRCAEKRVLHLGCTDSPFTKNFLRKGKLLHEKLLKVSSTVVGVDNSREATNYLKQELKIEDIYIVDVCNLDQLFSLEPFDIILAGELIEHLDNPSGMLKGATKLLKPDGIFLATVPNALCCQNLFGAQNRMEIVHKEHTAWYSCQTISRLFEMCGYEKIRLFGYTWGDNWLMRRFLKFSPLFCDGIIVEAKPCQTPA
jgi:2-polyprenyl-3-methyl-5-hydroxy-6-metoxy-1,4-benzoquinol methylase